MRVRDFLSGARPGRQRPADARSLCRVAGSAPACSGSSKRHGYGPHTMARSCPPSWSRLPMPPAMTAAGFSGYAILEAATAPTWSSTGWTGAVTPGRAASSICRPGWWAGYAATSTPPASSGTSLPRIRARPLRFMPRAGLRTPDPPRSRHAAVGLRQRARRGVVDVARQRCLDRCRASRCVRDALHRLDGAHDDIGARFTGTRGAQSARERASIGPLNNQVRPSMEP